MSSSTTYDVIVIGLGAMGSAATYHLAKRGVRVLGIEMFEPGHDQGSSHGHHRMIRKSSLDDDGYVPLATRAFELWSELEAESGKELLRITGEVRLVDPGNSQQKRANIAKLQQRGFVEVLDQSALAERFPGFRLYDGMLATYEADAGFLWSERGIITHVEAARRAGATIRTGEEVTGWEPDGSGYRVTTSQGTDHAERLVITAGPWTAELLNGVTFPFQVIRSVNGYFEPERPDWWTIEQGAPDFLLDVPEGSYYGISSVDGIGVKIGRSATEWGTPTTARTIRRTIDDAEIQMMRDALDRYMPGSAGRELKRITCMCTYTVDDNWIIDRHPRHDGVLLACGFSGIGFKFSPTVGEIMADLATTGETRHDIAFLSADRFAGDAAD
jgi:sarcosine oxidase